MQNEWVSGIVSRRGNEVDGEFQVWGTWEPKKKFPKLTLDLFISQLFIYNFDNFFLYGITPPLLNFSSMYALGLS